MSDFFYKKLDAYKIAKEYTIYVYSLLRNFPNYEQYALCSQLRKAAVSVPSNIVEGMGRMAVKERIHFLTVSYGSMAEVLCQLDIAQSLGYITEQELEVAEEISDRLGRVLSGLRKSLLDKLSNQKLYNPGE
ncbi:MAG: four helix bundle protein [Prevotella sp.]|nr:four helix bundle protein [Prevotella sp.]MBR7087392.1 four helix bundle protein [Prevotella sp.]